MADVETCFRVDVRAVMRCMTSTGSRYVEVDTSTPLRREVLRCRLDVEHGSLVVDHRIAGASQREIVALDVTVPNFGGHRWWGRCPGCDARIGILFALPWDGHLRCRKCLGLRYELTHATPARRALRRVQRLRRRLGGTAAGSVFKPKRMRWATFERLRGELRAAEEAHRRPVAARASGRDE